MAQDYVAVDGAILQCSLGSTPSNLSVIGVRKCEAGGKAIAIVTDSSAANTGTFGTCPNLGPGPCVPATPGNWTLGCTKGKCGVTAMIKKSDVLACTVGGTISITNAGQTKVKAE